MTPQIELSEERRLQLVGEAIYMAFFAWKKFVIAELSLGAAVGYFLKLQLFTGLGITSVYGLFAVFLKLAYCVHFWSRDPSIRGTATAKGREAAKQALAEQIACCRTLPFYFLTYIGAVLPVGVAMFIDDLINWIGTLFAS